MALGHNNVIILELQLTWQAGTPAHKQQLRDIYREVKMS